MCFPALPWAVAPAVRLIRIIEMLSFGSVELSDSHRTASHCTLVVYTLVVCTDGLGVESRSPVLKCRDFFTIPSNVLDSRYHGVLDFI